MHHLPPDYREWIAAAAMLSEVGSFINRTGRHRHTYYLIANSEIFGYSAEQRRVIAAIARYLGKTRPTPGDRAMRAVPLAHRNLIPQAVSMLRMARALDQGRRGAVKKDQSEIKGWKRAFELSRPSAAARNSNCGVFLRKPPIFANSSAATWCFRLPELCAPLSASGTTAGMTNSHR